jgi:hypothetical protein
MGGLGLEGAAGKHTAAGGMNFLSFPLMEIIPVPTL